MKCKICANFSPGLDIGTLPLCLYNSYKHIHLHMYIDDFLFAFPRSREAKGVRRVNMALFTCKVD